MLTDILAHRYLDHPIWSGYTELEQRLLNQAFGIVKEALPYYNSEGKVIEARKATWKALHDRTARELGVKELAQRYYSYNQKSPLGQDWPVQGWFERWLRISEHDDKWTLCNTNPGLEPETAG